MSAQLESDDLNFMESISLDEETWAAVRCSFNRQDQERLENAVQKSAETGQLTPLVKEELWCFIQRRRLENGEEEITVDDTHSSNATPEDCDSTSAADGYRRLVRMEQNRRAAGKYRNKKRQEETNTEQEISRLESANINLQREINCLEEEKFSLTETLRLHEESCQRHVYPESPVDGPHPC